MFSLYARLLVQYARFQIVDVLDDVTCRVNDWWELCGTLQVCS